MSQLVHFQGNPVTVAGAQVRSVKEMGSRHFVLIDAGFNDLMRPSMYVQFYQTARRNWLSRRSVP